MFEIINTFGSEVYNYMVLKLARGRTYLYFSGNDKFHFSHLKNTKYELNDTQDFRITQRHVTSLRF